MVLYEFEYCIIAEKRSVAEVISKGIRDATSPINRHDNYYAISVANLNVAVTWLAGHVIRWTDVIIDKKEREWRRKTFRELRDNNSNDLAITPDRGLYKDKTIDLLHHWDQLTLREQYYNILEFKKRQAKEERIRPILTTITELASKSRFIIGATDRDREGEGMLMQTLLFLHINPADQQRCFRWTSEVKDEELMKELWEKEFPNFPPVDLNLGYEGMLRGKLDYMWGVMFGTLVNEIAQVVRFGKTSYRGRSAFYRVGRVKCPLISFMVEKNELIKTWQPTIQKTVTVTIHGQIKGIIKRFFIIESPSMDPAYLYDTLNFQHGIINAIDYDQETSDYFPHSLESLQSHCRTMGITDIETKQIAEWLYAQGCISYPRTDGRSLPEGQNWERVFQRLALFNIEVAENFEVLVQQTPTSSQVQQAHDGLYPTGKRPRGLKIREELVYNEILTQFIHCFMSPVKITRTVTAKSNGILLYNKEYAQSSLFEEPKPFTPVQLQEPITFMIEVTTDYKKTEKPTPPSVEDIKTWMKDANMGTFADRDDHIQSLLSFYSTSTRVAIPDAHALSLVKVLKKEVPELLEPNFTATLEKQLEDIKGGKLNWQTVFDQEKQTFIELSERLWKHRNKLRSTLQDFGSCKLCQASLAPDDDSIRMRTGEIERFRIFKCPNCDSEAEETDTEMGEKKK